MDRNIKIAKELVRLAKSLVASPDDLSEFKSESDVSKEIDKLEDERDELRDEFREKRNIDKFEEKINNINNKLKLLKLKYKYYGLLSDISYEKNILDMNDFGHSLSRLERNPSQSSAIREKMEKKLKSIGELFESKKKLKKELEENGIEVPKAGDYRDDMEFNDKEYKDKIGL